MLNSPLLESQPKAIFSIYEIFEENNNSENFIPTTSENEKNAPLSYQFTLETFGNGRKMSMC